MKSNSIVKLLTAVTFSLVTMFSHVGLGKDETSTSKSDDALVRESEKKDCEEVYKSDPEKVKLCKYCLADSHKNDRKCSEFTGQSNNKCEEALKKFQEKQQDYRKACRQIKSPSARPQSQQSTDSLFGDNASKQAPLVQIDETKDCQARLKDCKDKMSNIASGAIKDDPNSVDNILKTVLAVKDPQTYQQYENMSSNNQQQGTQTMTVKSCTDSFTDKDYNQKKKDYKTEKKELEKELAKFDEDFQKEVKEQNEKSAEITKKIEELQSKSKEKNRDSDVKLREKNTENQKNSVNYAKQARDINNKILAKQVQLKKLQFDYANRLLSETTEKINMQCQAVMSKAQECLVKSIKLKATVSEDCKSFPVLSTKRGAAATAELKNKLKFINDQCYQEADTSKKNSAYTQQETIAQINRDIQNLQQDLQDLQNNINIESNNSAKIQQEAQREQDENAQSVAQQTQNFNNELQGILSASTKNQERLALKKKDILLKIEELDLEAKTGTESSLTAVDGVVSDYESIKESSKLTCECDKGANPVECGQIDSLHEKASSALKAPNSKNKPRKAPKDDRNGN